jgi:2-polyprenyl-3-methyl-5-hydroxy-6-metoxy-1,4-benzoquinol methylase
MIAMTKSNNNQNCRLCGSSKMSLFVDLGELPIAHRYVEDSSLSEEIFLYEVHRCRTCGLRQILNPIPEKTLYRDYNYCFTSWKPEPHRSEQLDMIKSIMTGTNVFEIGCNDGTFLEVLELNGFQKCVGVEPNPLSSQFARQKGFAVYEDWIRPEVCVDAVQKYGHFDNVISRHVIEHIADLRQFFACVDMVLKPGGFLMLDAPDCGAAIEMGDASVLWEEHVNYFDENTMQAMLRGYGYEIVALKRFLFTGESLSVIARRTPNGKNGAQQFDREAASLTGRSAHVTNNYSGKMETYAAELRDVLAARKKAGETVILFGVGARGVMTVNALGLKDSIDVAFDDQPEKQGKYMPGSGLAIRDPKTVSEYSAPITCLLAVNNENEEAVVRRMTDLSSQNITYSSLFSPKDIWRELDALRA